MSIWDEIAAELERTGGWSGYVPTPEFESERDFADYVLDQLTPWFTVEREVRGRACDGKPVRVDAVLVPRDPSQWKDEAPALAVEFKNPSALLDTRDVTRWQAQCVDYSHAAWDGYGRLPIFACPGFRYSDESTRFTVSRMLGQFRVGELRNLKWYGWAFILHEDHRQWSQRYGVEEAKRTRLVPTTGAR